MYNPQKVLVVVGPTGSGKTSFVLRLLREIAGEIISADSRQVYRHLDYTTNKLDLSEGNYHSKIEKYEGYWLQDGVKINFYDIVEPQDNFSVSGYVDLAVQKINELQGQQNLTVIVGGTGFYVDALLGISPFSNIAPNTQLREKLQHYDLQKLQETLIGLDKKAADLSRSELSNRVRLVRYIELAKAAGSIRAATEFSSIRDQVSSRQIELRFVGLRSSLAYLYQRADEWVNRLVSSEELFSETEMLRAKRPETENLLRGLIYAPTSDCLDGRITFAELPALIKGQIHRYVRRQLIWFKRNDQIKWIDVANDGWQQPVIKELIKWYH